MQNGNSLDRSNHPARPDRLVRHVGMRSFCGRHVIVVCAAGLLASCAGCLNPDLVNTKTGALYPIAPGDEAFVLIRVINDTTATLDVPVVYDDGTTVHEYQITGLTPEARETGLLVDWPVTRIALGDLDDPFLPNIKATQPDGAVSGVPFGQRALVRDVDYSRGDAIIFYVNADARNPVFITVSVGLIDADTEPTSFTRADPFEAVRLILAISGF